MKQKILKIALSPSDIAILTDLQTQLKKRGKKVTFNKIGETVIKAYLNEVKNKAVIKTAY